MQTPIIAADVPGITNAFQDLPGCYLIDRESTDDFVNAVNEIYYSDHNMGHEEFINRFNMKRNYAQYVRIYESLSTWLVYAGPLIYILTETISFNYDVLGFT